MHAVVRIDCENDYVQQKAIGNPDQNKNDDMYYLGSHLPDSSPRACKPASAGVIFWECL